MHAHQCSAEIFATKAVDCRLDDTQVIRAENIQRELLIHLIERQGTVLRVCHPFSLLSGKRTPTYSLSRVKLFY